MMANLSERIPFLSACLEEKLTPRSMSFRLPGKFNYCSGLKCFTVSKMIRQEIDSLRRSLALLEDSTAIRFACLRSMVTDPALRARICSLVKDSSSAGRSRARFRSENRLRKKLLRPFSEESEVPADVAVKPVTN